MLTAISPIDGRYHTKVKELEDYFSEAALIRYRIFVELEYFIAMNKLGLKNFPLIADDQIAKLKGIFENFDIEDARAVKDIERVTNHDVKAVEYFIKNKMDEIGLSDHKEWVHFGLTSQDINNTAFPLMVRDAMNEVYLPLFEQLLKVMNTLADEYSKVPMLARTHGQPASPTTLGKEWRVYIERLNEQMDNLKSLPVKGKFGGATGNLNAHKVCFPDQDWKNFANDFLIGLGIERSYYTTQIAHYDHMAALFHALARINTIWIDFSRDVWTYISMNYFKQKTVANEVGSSAMPHKVNPIDFENAEGNHAYANAIFEFLARKLPISRLQRDLTDSTVMRNIGVPIAHSIIGFKSLLKGLGKLELNAQKLHDDLEDNWAVVAEAIQNILRREQYPSPYETLKNLTRGNHKIDKNAIIAFIDTLEISDEIKEELKAISPHNYVGYE